MIKEAAIKLNGKIYTGRRHSDILHDKSRPKGYLKYGTQGFTTDDGKFVTRIEAAKIAFECGQIKEQMGILFSEDLD